MKQFLCLLAASLLLLTLTACGPVQEEPTTVPTTAPTTVPTTEPTTEPTTAPTTEPTTAPTTEPTTEPTEPPTEPTTEPTEPLIFEWTPLTYESLSYSKYLSESRAATDYCVGLFWIGQDGETEYFLDFTAGGWDVFNRADQWPPLWTIPGSDAYSGINLMLCDGEWAYGTRNQTELIRVELLTGNIEVLFTADRMMCWPVSEQYAQNATLVDRDWLYFLAKVDDYIGIYRMYLPELRLDLLSDDIPGDTMPYALDLHVPADTQYLVTCVYLNPAIQDLVLNTLADPDSPYKTTFEFSVDSQEEPAVIDLTLAWDVQDPANALTVPIQLDFLVIRLQEDYDILAKRCISCYLYDGTISDIDGWAKPYFSFSPNDMPSLG